MKSQKLGLIAAIALGGLMACGPIARAQDSTNTPPPAGGDNANPRPPRRGNPMQAILAKLDLTADQKEKIKPIMSDVREKMTALREDTSLSREDRRDKMKTINDAADAKLKEILTPDQYTKFLDLRKQMMGRRPGGPAGGATPPPASNSQ
jgi:periplasmic protein CpxP/Spy